MSGPYDFEEQERIAELKAWWEDNRWYVVGSIVAAIVAFAGYRGWVYWSARQNEDAAAMFAPVAGLGLVVLWDDGDDLHAEGCIQSRCREEAVDAAGRRRGRARSRAPRLQPLVPLPAAVALERASRADPPRVARTRA